MLVVVLLFRRRTYKALGGEVAGDKGREGKAGDKGREGNLSLWIRIPESLFTMQGPRPQAPFPLPEDSE